MDYSESKFTNNFIFCKVLENDLDLCKGFLERKKSGFRDDEIKGKGIYSRT